MKNIELKVEGMSCGHCKASVEKALKGVSGVEKVEVYLQEGKALVEGSAPVDKLIEAIQEEGYSASASH